MGRFLRTFPWLRALATAARCWACRGQAAPAGPVVPPQTVVDVLHGMSDKAEIIFAGQVMADPPAPMVARSELWKSNFAWTRPSADVLPGRLTSCASGLACGRATVQRYRVGQRLLMLSACAQRSGDEFARRRHWMGRSRFAGRRGASVGRQSATPPQHPVCRSALAWSEVAAHRCPTGASLPVRPSRLICRCRSLARGASDGAAHPMAIGGPVPMQAGARQRQLERSFSPGAAGLRKCVIGTVEFVAEGHSMWLRESHGACAYDQLPIANCSHGCALLVWLQRRVVGGRTAVGDGSAVLHHGGSSGGLVHQSAALLYRSRRS